MKKYKGLTPHIDAQLGEIAKTVLMPGDPLRAKFIAEKYFENIKVVNDVRGMLAFTGTYNGHELTIMGSGMGIPSMGIYSSELFEFYGVENIIRIGSCGTVNKDIKLYDIIVAEESHTHSTYHKQVLDEENYVLKGNAEIISQTKKSYENLNLNSDIIFGKVHCGDSFYKSDKAKEKSMVNLINNNIIGLEMESFALYTNANRFNKRALTILSVSDHAITGEVTTSEQRQNSFTDMMELSLDVAINI